MRILGGMGENFVCVCVYAMRKFLLCVLTKNKFKILIDLKNSLHSYREKQWIDKAKC